MWWEITIGLVQWESALQQFRRENLDKDTTTIDEIRRGNLEKSGKVDFDMLRRENLDKDAVNFDELREENLEKTGKVDFDMLRRENLDKDAVDFDELRREYLDTDFAAVGTEHVAHPVGEARILVVEHEGSV